MEPDSTYSPIARTLRGPAAGAGRAASEPPRPGRASLHEATAARPFDAAATAFVLAALPETGAPVLWVQDRLSRREGGRLYLPGSGKPALRAPILRVEVSHPRDVLWAMEEGAACGSLAAVVGEIHGDPAVLDFTATKRLALRSDASGVPVWLIRAGGAAGLSAARERWRLTARPSAAHPHDPDAPGEPIWEAELFRARSRPPGVWEARHERPGEAAREPGRGDRAGAGDRTTDRLRLVPPSRDRALASGHGPGPRAARA